MRRCVYAWQGALGSLALHGYRRVALGGALARGDEGLRRGEGALMWFRRAHGVLFVCMTARQRLRLRASAWARMRACVEGACSCVTVWMRPIPSNPILPCLPVPV